MRWDLVGLRRRRHRARRLHPSSRWLRSVTPDRGVKLPSFLRSVEYDFDKLSAPWARKERGRSTGPARRIASSRAADEPRGAHSFVLADRPEQVALVKERIPRATPPIRKGWPSKAFFERLGLSPRHAGGAARQAQRVLEDALPRARITPRCSQLSPEEAKDLEEMIPPESLRVLGLDDLPAAPGSAFAGNGTVGTVGLLRSLPAGGGAERRPRVLLRMATTIDEVVCPTARTSTRRAVPPSLPECDPPRFQA